MGTCDSTTGTCTCNDGCFGPDCSVVCPGNCEGIGKCVYDENTNTAGT